MQKLKILLSCSNTSKLFKNLNIHILYIWIFKGEFSHFRLRMQINNKKEQIEQLSSIFFYHFDKYCERFAHMIWFSVIFSKNRILGIFYAASLSSKSWRTFSNFGRAQKNSITVSWFSRSKSLKISLTKTMTLSCEFL